MLEIVGMDFSEFVKVVILAECGFAINNALFCVITVFGFVSVHFQVSIVVPVNVSESTIAIIN